jgi:hypothetical protein
MFKDWDLIRRVGRLEYKIFGAVYPNAPSYYEDEENPSVKKELEKANAEISKLKALVRELCDYVYAEKENNLPPPSDK